MSDAIDRQSVIGYIDRVATTGMGKKQSLKYIRLYIEKMPSAQQCYKTDHGYMWLCPECGLEVHSDFDRCVRCGWERRTV